MTMKKKPEFEKVAGVQNLYWRERIGSYVHRVTLNGTRSWRSLETDILSVAKLRLREAEVANEKARQLGAKIAPDQSTLGALAKEFEERMAQSRLVGASKEGYKAHLKRLRENWQEGSFEHYQVRRLTLDAAFRLREHLSERAVVKYGKPGVGVTRGRGYSNTVVNETLVILRRLVDLAVDKHLLVENPLKVGRGVLRDRLMLAAEPEVPELPDRETLHRLFDEMRKVPGTSPCDAWTEVKQRQANEAADLAEFLAYSGARFREALLVKVKFYTPAAGRAGTLYIPGYKTASADRTIPVIPPLARLLDRLIVGKGPEDRICVCNSALLPLRKACKRLGLARLTQHHLRHYFATYCIEKTRDIPTVASWLGHNDGGRVLARVYRHLRVDHSLAIAALCDDAEVEQVDFRNAAAQSAVQSKTG